MNRDLLPVLFERGFMKHRFFFVFRPVRCVLLALVAVISIVLKMQGQDLQFTPELPALLQEM